MMEWQAQALGPLTAESVWPWTANEWDLRDEAEVEKHWHSSLQLNPFERDAFERATVEELTLVVRACGPWPRGGLR